MHVALTGWSSCLLVLLVSGCASGPRSAVARAVDQRDVPQALEAYERYRGLDGPDTDLLAHVASVVLEETARSDDPALRRPALGQLSLAGSAGEPVLERLADDGASPVIQAAALEVLARRGRGYAREYLYALTDSDDPEVLAAAISAVDVDDEMVRLLEWLGHTSAAVRRSAAQRLAEAAPHTEARLALSEVARIDPLPEVRGAAVRSLAAYGADALEALRSRLGDPASSVRLAAVRGLVQADEERGPTIVAGLLQTQPSPAGIEAARVVIMTARSAADAADAAESAADPLPAVVDARAYLRQALAAGSARLRSQAGIALASLRREPSLDEALLHALAAEKEPPVRLQLARALTTRDEMAGAARKALESLLEEDGMPAVQSAVVLARGGHAGAISRLKRALDGDEPVLRRVAARALAREAGRPDAVRQALLDPDPMVRVYAAGGILAASND